MGFVRGGVIVLVMVQLAGCASYRTERKADHLIQQGQLAQGIGLYQGLAQASPERYRLKYISARDKATRDLLHNAQLARFQGKADEALADYQQVMAYDPRNAEALHGVELIARDREAQQQLEKARMSLAAGDRQSALDLLDDILVQDPAQAEARRLRQQIEMERNRSLLAEPALKASLRKPVSLEFRNATLQSVLEVLSQASGISFIFDRDVRPDARTTLFAKDTTVEDALGLILRTSQLNQKVLNDSTLLIYPATADKEKQYEDLVMRTFYLGNADPRKVQEMVRALVSPKSMYVDESLKMLVVRDNLSVIETVERLVNAYDLAAPEVVLEVEVLEVNAGDSLTLGIQYPDSASAGVIGAAGKPGQLTLNEARDLGRGNFQLFFPDPLAVLNLKQTSDKTRTLANPRIRVSNHEKARVMVGDKVPVITTSLNQTSAVSTESVSYLDVGLKLEVQPEIHVNNDVSIDINLEVSDIVKSIKSTTGLLTYQIGTRSANTTLRLRDGETQVLAGLIKDEQRDSASHLPGLGKIPLLGRLFSSETNASNKSEIVLLITPHVVKSLETPAAHVMEFASGTGNRASTRPLRLTSAARYSSADARIMPGNDSPAAPVALADATDQQSAAMTALKLDMVTPTQIAPGREFTVALLSSGKALQDMELELAFDQPGIRMVRAAPVAATTQLEAEQQEQSLKLKVGALPASSGPLAMLTFTVPEGRTGPLVLSLRNARAHRADSSAITPAVPAPRIVQVLP